jgi:hypothetical protein
MSVVLWVVNNYSETVVAKMVKTVRLFICIFSFDRE